MRYETWFCWRATSQDQLTSLLSSRFLFSRRLGPTYIPSVDSCRPIASHWHLLLTTAADLGVRSYKSAVCPTVCKPYVHRILIAYMNGRMACMHAWHTFRRRWWSHLRIRIWDCFTFFINYPWEAWNFFFSFLFAWKEQTLESLKVEMDKKSFLLVSRVQSLIRELTEFRSYEK